MPSLIDLRRRIRSVKNTQQITKAMKMVSAAKLRRAQEQVLASRPYASLLSDVLNSVLSSPGGKEGFDHPLLAVRRPKKILLLLLSGDKGLCGGFNTNILKEARLFLEKHKDVEVELELIGKKGRDFYARRDYPISGEWINVFSKVEHSTASEIATKVSQRFADEEIDAVYLLYSKFVSAMTQTPTVVPLLPFSAEDSAAETSEFIYGQPPEEIFASTLPRYVDIQVYQAMLESAASEHSARMAAMEAATRNAGEMIDTLTLKLNRARQASITTEIIEIVSGAAALE